MAFTLGWHCDKDALGTYCVDWSKVAPRPRPPIAPSVLPVDPQVRFHLAPGRCSYGSKQSAALFLGQRLLFVYFVANKASVVLKVRNILGFVPRLLRRQHPCNWAPDASSTPWSRTTPYRTLLITPCLGYNFRGTRWLTTPHESHYNEPVLLATVVDVRMVSLSNTLQQMLVAKALLSPSSHVCTPASPSYV
jgi:hypothetical protein